MYYRTFMMFMFVSTFDHEFNISDIDNIIDIDIFTCVYDHKFVDYKLLSKLIDN